MISCPASLEISQCLRIHGRTEYINIVKALVTGSWRDRLPGRASPMLMTLRPMLFLLRYAVSCRHLADHVRPGRDRKSCARVANPQVVNMVRKNIGQATSTFLQD